MHAHINLLMVPRSDPLKIGPNQCIKDPQKIGIGSKAATQDSKNFHVVLCCPCSLSKSKCKCTNMKDQKLQLIIIYTNHSIAQTHIFKNKVSKFQLMALLSFFNCFGTPHSSGQVSDYYAEGSQLKSSSSEKSKSKPKSKGAPIVVSYFPVNHYPSRL
ncbi:hypothetical protein VNO77_26022 [Canavalia gladiata]|uniref:Uncharacterized protein n=1 Tax=Canavalia gladiata TaxID=3824 RepID=A0AAN9KUL8_CANGL